MKLVYSLIAVFVLGTVAIPAEAATNSLKQEYKRTVERKFDIAKDGKTMLDSRYGSIGVKTWDKNQVQITVDIIVNATSESRAQATFDRIKIEFDSSSDYVKAETQIESRSGWNNSGSDYKIVYEVFLPATNSLVVDMKYGNVSIEEMLGRVVSETSYGNVHLEGVGDNSTVELSYGKGSITRAEDLNAEVSYGNLDIYEAKDVKLETKYSKISIEEGADVICETKYDTYKIGTINDFRNEGKYDNFYFDQVDNIIVSTKYTQVNIDRLTNSFDLDCSYGGASIKELAKGFSMVNVISNYASIKIGVTPNTSYQLKASGNYASVKLPENLKVKQDIRRSTSFEIVGYQGTEDARSIIKLKPSYGGIKIYENN